MSTADGAKSEERKEEGRMMNSSSYGRRDEYINSSVGDKNKSCIVYEVHMGSSLVRRCRSSGLPALHRP